MELLLIQTTRHYSPIMDGVRLDDERRHWMNHIETEVNIDDIGKEMGQMATEIKIAFPVSHNTLTSIEEYVQ